MAENAAADLPLTIDRVERGRGEGGSVRLRLTGRWLGAGHPGEHEALLVISLDGRRHRFPPIAEPGSASPPPGAWTADFSLPSWAEPTRAGQAALWVGNAVIPVPAPGTAKPAPSTAPPPQPSQSASQPGSESSAPPAPTPALTVAPDPGEGSRGGPLADLLFKETVSALHSELEQRSADAARLRGALADAQSELEARSALQAGLEAAHAELRAQVQELMGAVEAQRAELAELQARAETERAELQRDLTRTVAEHDERAAEVAALRQRLEAEGASLREEAASAQRRLREEVAALRDQLATASVSRDAAVSEAAGLRAELERLGSELAVTRERIAARGGDLGEAERLLADARALTAQLRGGGWR